MSNLLAYKLRRTFRLWDVVTIIGACLLITAPCVGALFYLKEWTAPAGTLIAAPALAWLIAVLFFRARWQFWAPVEYVTRQGLAVRQFDPNAVLEWNGVVRRTSVPHPDEQAAVTDIVDETVGFWTEPSDRSPAVSPLQSLGAGPGDVEALRIVRGAVLLWREDPFKTTHWRWRDRWLSGLRKGERMEVSWKPDTWDTALSWELSGVLVNLVADVWGEARVNGTLRDAGFSTGNLRR
jgi:hypothetical protein